MNANSPSQSRDLRGTWGGEHIAMEVTDAGATIEYDCAHGRITEKIAPNPEGKFETKGVHTRVNAVGRHAKAKITSNPPSIADRSRPRR